MITQEAANSVLAVIRNRGIPDTTTLSIMVDLQNVDGGQSFNDSIQLLIRTLHGKRKRKGKV